jgi:hypothetical protein
LRVHWSRISLTLRPDDEPDGQARAPRQTPARKYRERADAPATGGAMADALRRAGLAGDRPAKS